MILFLSPFSSSSRQSELFSTPNSVSPSTNMPSTLD